MKAATAIIETNFFIVMIIKLLLFFILSLTNIYNFRNSTLNFLLINNPLLSS
jgi:hypothetical protein